MVKLTKKQSKDLRTLMAFIEVYCQGRHAGADKNETLIPEARQKGVTLCLECASLLHYAEERLRKCPLDPKPSCKHCHIHCYRKDHRAKIREVMAYSGRRLLMKGRLDYLWHYFF